MTQQVPNDPITNAQNHGENFDLKEEIRAYWSDRAERFDESASHHIEAKYGVPEWHKMLRRAFGLAPDQNLQGASMLDIACGTGEISRVLCDFGATVTGLDFSDAMHAKSRAKLENQNWQALTCDAELLVGVPDNSFDYAITRHLVWTLTDHKAAFSEWERVLKPGGKILIIDGNFSKKRGLFQRCKWWVAGLLEASEPRSPEEMHHHQDILNRLPFRDGLYPENLKADMEKAGFVGCRNISVKGLYRAGMRGWPLPTRLRQTSANRFALVGTTRL
ncbi:hypothetical protein A9Q94_16040 [Rhodobacterales bacterium 56_14_T64]|nr:hypothetical protein A9Q94_16040 [Rhodobacterales bacterium 56_14_T64]